MNSEAPDILRGHLYDLNLTELSNTVFPTKKERLENIKLVRAKVRAVKKEMNREIKIIKAKWDGRNSYEATQERLHLAEFIPLEKLLSDIEIYLKEFEIKGENAEPAPIVGTHYYGDFEKADWYIGSELEAYKWLAKNTRMQASKARDYQKQLISDMKNLKQVVNSRLVLNRMFYLWNSLVAILVIFIIVFSIVFSNLFTLELLLMFLGLAFMLVIVAVINYRQKVNNHNNDVLEAKKELSQLKTENENIIELVGRLKTQFQEIQQKIQELS